MSAKRDLGVKPMDHLAMDIEQAHACAICGAPPPPGGALVVDHDHATGRIRGLLCGRCNIGLGWFDDQPQLLDRAIKYLLEGPGFDAAEPEPDVIIPWSRLMAMKPRNYRS